MAGANKQTHTRHATRRAAPHHALFARPLWCLAENLLAGSRWLLHIARLHFPSSPLHPSTTAYHQRLQESTPSNMSSNSPQPPDWGEFYGQLYSRRVDLVGDYAGSEPFLVEGDSLLLHCFSDELLDFEGSPSLPLLRMLY